MAGRFPDHLEKVYDMTEPQKLYVLGAGAMGSLFGGLLAEGGMDVTLIDPWAEHVDAIEKNGLKKSEL